MAAMMLNKSSVVVGRTRQTAPCKASQRAVVVRAARETWYPGATPPAHLDGSMVGDYGFDPLRLGTDPGRIKWFREAELYNGRWAMAGVVGMLFTELVGLPKWYLAGAEKYPLDTQTLAIIEFLVFAVVEGTRYEGYKKTGGGGVLFMFPFDPMGMRSPTTELKEVKNGRLAMLAFLGFCSTAAVNDMGPLESLWYHISDPTNHNIYTTSVGPESAVAVSLLAVWPIIIEATKSLGSKDSVPLFPWNEEWKKVAK